MRQTPFNFSVNELKKLAAEIAAGKKEFTPAELQLQQNHAAELEAELKAIQSGGESEPDTTQPGEPVKPESSFFEKYKVLLLIIAVLALVIFFWKFKIVSKTAAIAAAAVA